MQRAGLIFFPWSLFLCVLYIAMILARLRLKCFMEWIFAFPISSTQHTTTFPTAPIRAAECCMDTFLCTPIRFPLYQETHQQTFVSEMIMEPECRSRLRPKFAFWAGTGAGVNILGSSRSRSRSRSRSQY